MRLLLDTDVLLDIALDRAPFYQNSRAVSDWCQINPGSALVAWHTISNLYYLLTGTRSDTKARNFIAGLLRFAEVVSGGNPEVQHALALPLRDFEDALQVAASSSAQAEFIITRNLKDYRGSPVIAIQPAVFLSRISRP